LRSRDRIAAPGGASIAICARRLEPASFPKEVTNLVSYLATDSLTGRSRRPARASTRGTAAAALRRPTCPGGMQRRQFAGNRALREQHRDYALTAAARQGCRPFQRHEPRSEAGRVSVWLRPNTVGVDQVVALGVAAGRQLWPEAAAFILCAAVFCAFLLRRSLFLCLSAVAVLCPDIVHLQTVSSKFC
jgi:hypothetical protein